MSNFKTIRKHPDYPDEKIRLDATLDKIDAYIDREEGLMPNGIHRGANQSVSAVLRPNAEARLADLRVRRIQPYYGRIDYQQENKIITVYIGREVLREEQYGEHKVASRHSEAASIFAKERAGRYYFERAGDIDLLLQRNLKLAPGYISHFHDNFDNRKKRGHTDDKGDTNQLTGREQHLIDVLYRRGDGNARLQDIVETLQEHQDNIIRAAADGCLIINGVAGSGKTSVAYHRVDYLVNAGNPRVQPEKTIIFGPNGIFLNHVRELLPGLGIHGVTETTFDDWVFTEMGYGTDASGNRKVYRLQDRTLPILLGNDAKAKNESWRQGRIKGNLKFAKLVEAYAAYRRSVLNLPGAGFSYAEIGLSGVTLTPAEIQEAHADAVRLDASFESQRQLFLTKVVALVKQKALHQLMPEDYEKLEPTILDVVRDDLDVACPAFDVHTDYYGLLRNPALLRKLGRNLFKAEELELVTRTSFPRSGRFDVQDVPALYYLHKLMARTPFETFDHIVVDEGQDLSPFQFMLLQMHSKNDSMTVLGDVAQAVHGYRGLNDWKELTPVFMKKPKRVDMNKSFRSTRPIVLVGNEILKEVRGDGANLAVPVPRDGPAPKLFQGSDEIAMYTRIADDLKSLLAEESSPSNIALITRTDDEVIKLERHLTNSGIKPDRVLTMTGKPRNPGYFGGVAILPAALSKGIEFEAVFVVQASDVAYNHKVPYDGRLFYVATTRALHQLDFYYTGAPTGFLTSAINSGILTSVPV